MPAINPKKELRAFIKKHKNIIVRQWSDQIFRIPAHLKLSNIITKQHHLDGMRRYLNAFISDITDGDAHRCREIMRKNILHGYLSASVAEDVIRGLIMFKQIATSMLNAAYKNDFERLQLFTNLLIALIDKVRICVLDTYRKRDFTRLTTIMKYGKKLLSIHDIDRLCELIVEAAMKESDSDRASIMLLEKDGYLCLKASIGIPKHVVRKELRQKLGVGIAGKVAKTGVPIIINEGQRLNPQIKKDLRGLGLCSAVSLPIFADSTMLGVLNLGKYHKKPIFDQEDVELLLILAYESGAAVKNCQLFEEIHELYIGSMISLATAIDTRDHYTHGHSTRVADLATNTAKKLKLCQDDIDKIYFASMLHDIGKIGIPDKILLKPGRLTEKEFEIIKKHPIYGKRILKHVPKLRRIIPIIYHEHERYDGKGYVDGLKGKHIPLESRIIAVADAYEAMTSNRPYRRSMPKAAALKEIKIHAGTQFDPKIVDVFIKTIK